MKKRRSTHPLRFLLGYNIITLSEAYLPKLINLCSREGISYSNITLGDGYAELITPFFTYKQLRRLAENEEIPLTLKESRGIPALLLENYARVGILLGLICSVVLIVFSQNLLFDIRIDGEKRLSEDDVKAVLNDCGLAVGKFKHKLDIDVIENRVLIASDDISWISINIIGSIAKVEIRELDFAPNDGEDLPPAANLVAELNGTVVGFENIKGNLAVTIGENISQGQLLVGGIFGDELRGFRYMAAQGKVLAEVNRSFEVSIPKKYQKKTYTGEEKCEKYLVFFEKEIKIFSNCRNLYPIYDKIDTVEYLRAPNGERLPIGIRTVRYIEYTYTEQTRSESSLAALAEYKMNILLADYEGNILEKKTDAALTDNSYTLVCRVYAIEDIAKMQKIDIN